MRPALLSLVLLAYAPGVAAAQRADDPIASSLYIAVGADPLREPYHHVPVAVSVGLERSSPGSRWALRFGGDYMRSATRSGDPRREEAAVGLAVRYGRSGGTIRPYLLAGVGIADLRTTGRWVKYETSRAISLDAIDTTVTTSARWNGVLSPGAGVEFRLASARMFTEARLNLYPRFPGADLPSSGRATKALFLGVRL